MIRENREDTEGETEILNDRCEEKHSEAELRSRGENKLISHND